MLLQQVKAVDMKLDSVARDNIQEFARQLVNHRSFACLLVCGFQEHEHVLNFCPLLAGVIED